MTHPALPLRASIALVCLAGSLPLAVAADSANGVSKGGAKVAEGRILVKLARGCPKRSSRSSSRSACQVRQEAEPARRPRGRGAVGEELRVANELNRDASVAFAEPDLLVPPRRWSTTRATAASGTCR